MLVIAAWLALFTTQSTSTTEPAAKPEPTAVEAQASKEVKPNMAAITWPVENGNQ